MFSAHAHHGGTKLTSHDVSVSAAGEPSSFVNGVVLSGIAEARGGAAVASAFFNAGARKLAVYGAKEVTKKQLL